MAIDQKIATVKALQELATTLAKVYQQAENFDKVYSHRDLESTLKDEDILDATGLTIIKVNAGVTLTKQLILFLNGQAITPANHLETISILRTDI